MTGRSTRPLSVEAAIATGAYEVLASIGAELPTPAALDFITQAYNDYMAALDDCDEVTRGVQLGHDAAAAMLALRAGDGSAGPAAVVFTSTGEPGRFRSTVGTATALTGPRAIPQWGNIRPFVLASGSQFRAPPMYGAATVEAAVQTPRVSRGLRRGQAIGGIGVGAHPGADRHRVLLAGRRSTRPGTTPRAASPRSATSTPGCWRAWWRTSRWPGRTP